MKNHDELEMRDEYDFSNGVRNPYVQRFQELNLIYLDADVKVMFPTSEAVNEALRQLMRAGTLESNPKKRAS